MAYDIDTVARMAERHWEQMDVVAHNVANANTPGFKASYLRFVAEASAAEGPDSASPGLPGPLTPAVSVDFAQGTVQMSGNVLDVAIQGEGFFAVEKTGGGVAYTRKGDFSLTRDGILVTRTGDHVQGESGRIVLKGDNVHIGEGGEIAVDGVTAGRLRIVRFADPRSLVRAEGGCFEAPAGVEAFRMENPQVKSRHLEMSNVQVIREMVAMIDLSRSFETYQKIIHTLSEQDKMSAGRIGKLI